LLKTTVNEILINRDFPNRFHHGDGVREYTIAWDNIARCANGIHLLNIGGDLDYSALDLCHQTEYSHVTGELTASRELLAERTEQLEQLSHALQERTQELVETREILIERTERLERASKALEQASKVRVGPLRKILARFSARPIK